MHSNLPRYNMSTQIWQVKFVVWIKYIVPNEYICYWFVLYIVYEIVVNIIYIKLTRQLVPNQTILQWRHNERDGVSNPLRHECLLNPLFRRRSKKTTKLHVSGLCKGNSPVTRQLPAQRASGVEKVSIWWRHHVTNDMCGIQWNTYDKCMYISGR